MINFNQLRVFYHTAKNLNFTIAARELFITQPAVTAQMKFFEDYCELKLFKKKGRGICLTEEGKALYEYAKKIFEYEKTIENAIEDMRKLKRGVLRIGTTKTYARYLMPQLICTFRKEYPDIRIHMNEGNSLNMVHSLLSFANELVIIAKVEDNPDICFIPFGQEELVAIVAPDHHLARKNAVSFRELADQPVIIKETGSGTRKLVYELFARHNCYPKILMETNNAEFIKQLVQRGEGISFLVKVLVTSDIQEKKLASVSLENCQVFLDVNIAYARKQPLSPPARAFLDMLEKLAAEEDSLLGLDALMAKI